MSSTWDNSWITGMHAQFLAGVMKAADGLADQMALKVSTPGPPASAPYTPAHIDTGQMIRSMDYEISEDTPTEIVALVGSPVPQALFTELGTSRMAPRSWCALTLAEQANQVKDDITG